MQPTPPDTGAASDQLLASFHSPYPGFAHGAPRLLPVRQRIGAPDGLTGQGVTIAFIDSGFSPHPDLDGRILAYADAGTPRVRAYSFVPASAIDLMSWHGQMTSVIAAGDGRTSGGLYAGAAPGASVVLVRVVTPGRRIPESAIARGLRWVLEVRARYNIRIVNISVGGDRPSADPNHPLHVLVRRLAVQGVLVTVAAGNSGSNMVIPPATAAEALVVGGIDDHNNPEPVAWSLFRHNWGTAYDGTAKPDVLAPANWLASPLLPGSEVEAEAAHLAPLLEAADADAPLRAMLRANGLEALQIPAIRNLSKPTRKLLKVLQARIEKHKLVDAHHQYVDGTSVAAPIVAGVAALMLEANPTLTPDALRALLRATAQPLERVPAAQQGAGVIHAGRAVAAATHPVQEAVPTP